MQEPAPASESSPETHPPVPVRASGFRLEILIDTLRRFWDLNVVPGGERVILVDLMVNDLGVALRSLTIANGIRRCEPLRLVGIIQSDPAWEKHVWGDRDQKDVLDLARAFGCTDFIELGPLAEALRQGGPATVRVFDTDLPWERTALAADYLDAEALSSALRILRFARDGEDLRAHPDTEPIMSRTRRFADVWETLFVHLDVAALIVAHVDYGPWGTGVNTAMLHEVPVVHTQSTGSLKAYAWFPENATQGTFRAQMTEQIAGFFEQKLWPHRELLRRSAEVVTARMKADVGGRPA